MANWEVNSVARNSQGCYSSPLTGHRKHGSLRQAGFRLQDFSSKSLRHMCKLSGYRKQPSLCCVSGSRETSLPMIERRSDMSVQAFAINIPQTTLDDLHERLARTRWPDEVSGAGWDYGTNLGYLKELVDYWQHTFDWRAQGGEVHPQGQFHPASAGGPNPFLHAPAENPCGVPPLLP